MEETNPCFTFPKPAPGGTGKQRKAIPTACAKGVSKEGRVRVARKRFWSCLRPWPFAVEVQVPSWNPRARASDTWAVRTSAWYACSCLRDRPAKALVGAEDKGGSGTSCTPCVVVDDPDAVMLEKGRRVPQRHPPAVTLRARTNCMTCLGVHCVFMCCMKRVLCLLLVA